MDNGLDEEFLHWSLWVEGAGHLTGPRGTVASSAWASSSRVAALNCGLHITEQTGGSKTGGLDVKRRKQYKNRELKNDNLNYSPITYETNPEIPVIRIYQNSKSLNLVP